ncbi:biotin--[acetyl-CoA-carboxylase] ligase [Marinivivus vitaminiproducens]|uniref:biotin--[acetyl-CoA-carboxylase] ligase n=1 Tax=Marinivivus vitaminiproducens TaxID=3035935 RepID=UPI00279DBF27|nr:biotin--[acetyl-CoA-carboxylase] ligase [Geminicoccaceae bacterium SCSIO 64248]
MTGPVLPRGYRLYAHETLGSTNDEARALGLAGEPGGAVVWARRQEAGRGRQGRAWQSPDGNLFVSFLVRPERPLPVIGTLGLVAGVALAEATAPLLAPSVELALKWPNDMLADGAKTAGILIEADRLPGEAHPFAVVGCGVNLVRRPAQAPYPTACLAELGAAPHVTTPEAMLSRLAEAWDRWYHRWLGNEMAAVRAAWLARAYRLGSSIKLRIGDRFVEGRFVDLDETGAIVLADGRGERTRFTIGEVL